MRVVLDTNIVLDVLCDRAPFNIAAKSLWARIESGDLDASLVSTTFTTIYYIVRKQLGSAPALEAVENLLNTYNVCPVDFNVLDKALAKGMADFEDAVVDAAAEMAGIPIIVTRDSQHFAGSSRRIMDAATLVGELSTDVQ